MKAFATSGRFRRRRFTLAIGLTLVSLGLSLAAAPGSRAEGKKLEQAKKMLPFCLKNPNEGDRLEIVRFSIETGPLFGRLVGASAANVARAEGWVWALKPIGGTAIEEALLQAPEPLKAPRAKGRPYTVVFLTDGKPTIGSTDDDEIIGEVSLAIGERPARIFPSWRSRRSSARSANPFSPARRFASRERCG